tara:strand:+ start:1161 stop:1664 length:504 start_codon:yes stop_codon:yes gene_type:complete
MKLDYDSISPVTGNKCVLEESNPKDNTTSFLCMESGFTSHEHLLEGTEFQEGYESTCTELMLSCKVVDDKNKAWYPAFMQMPGAMLYSEGTSAQSWNWRVAKIVPLLGEERKKYPIMGKENEYHTSRLDVENAKTYDKDNFKTALDDLYSIVKEAYDNENKLRNNSM